MRNRISIFWLSLSVLYLLVELMFRADVIDLAATTGDQHQLLALEHVGRFISSLGFAIFLTSLLKTNTDHSGQQKKYRRLAMLPVFVLSYLGAAHLQEWAIEKYASETPPEFKREAMLANSYRDLAYFGQVKKDPSLSWLTSDEKVLLALTPALMYGNPEIESLASDSSSDLIGQLNYLKLEKNASLSDPRVFDYHRQWVRMIAMNYDYRVHTERLDTNVMITHEKELLYKLMLSEGWKTVKSASGQMNNSVELVQEPSYARYESFFDIYDDRKSTPSVIDHVDGFTEALYDRVKGVYIDYLGLNRKKLRHLFTHYDDETLIWFFEHNDFESLKKYYGLKLSMKDACSIYPGKQNEFMLVMNKQKKLFFSQSMSERMAKDMHVMLKGSLQKSPIIVACDYSYETGIRQMRNLSAILSQRTPAFNPAAAKRLVVTDAGTVKRHSLFKYAAVAAMLEEDRKRRQTQSRINKGNKLVSPTMTQFEDMAQYDRFVNSIDLSTVESFDRSLRYAEEAIARESFVTFAARAGLDFSTAMQPRRGFGGNLFEVYEDPKFVSVFKKAMPQIFDEKGRFIAQNIPQDTHEIKAYVKTLPEKSREKIRWLYADVMSGKQENILDDSSIVGQGMKQELQGKTIAKGFIAPAFVLFVSNIMIALTLVSVISTLIQAYFFESPSVVRSLVIGSVVATLLIAPSMLINNQHIEKGMPSTAHESLVWQAHVTANLQKTYDIILPSFVRPNWLYQLIKLSVSPKERFVQLHG